MNFSISGLQFGAGMLLLSAFIIGIILFLKHRISSTSISKKGSNHLTKKYAEADVFKSSGTFWRVGLVSAVFVAILAFSWTTYERDIFIPDYNLSFDELEIQTPPTVQREKKLPPPPPPPPVIEVTDEPTEEPPIFTDQTVTNQVSNQVAKPTTKKTPLVKKTLPIVPKSKEPNIEELHYIVEEMPLFPGCEGIGNYETEKACADKKMLEFIYKNIKYPTIARENNVEGTAVISFVVEKDGSITNATIIRDPGAGCGAESLRVVELMNKLPQRWIPGQQGNQNVRVQFNLPVRFRLDK